MACKKPITVLVRDEEGEECWVEAVLHPRGCMGARQQHIDIPVDSGCRPLSLLADAGYGGYEARCHTIGDCMVLDLSGLGMPVIQVCARDLRLSCPLFVYLRKRHGKVYLGPVVLG